MLKIKFQKEQDVVFVLDVKTQVFDCNFLHHYLLIQRVMLVICIVVMQKLSLRRQISNWTPTIQFSEITRNCLYCLHLSYKPCFHKITACFINKRHLWKSRTTKFWKICCFPESMKTLHILLGLFEISAMSTTSMHVQLKQRKMGIFMCWDRESWVISLGASVCWM